MSKIAEQRALEAYPPDTYYSYVYERRVDMNSQQRACFKEGYEAAKKDLGWISVKERLPEERKEYSDTLQGHREWTESDRVFVADDFGDVRVDALRNGKFRTDGYKDCDGFPHWIEYWMPIPELPKEK